MTWTKKERRAILFLAWTIVILVGVRYWLSQDEVSLRLLATDQTENQDQQMKPGSFRNKKAGSTSNKSFGDTPGTDETDASSTEKGASRAAKEQPQLFNPNSAPFEILVAAGLPERVAHTMINYREKGGKFYKPEDLLKIYIMTDSIFRKVEPWIQIPPTPRMAARDRPRDPIDINQADAEEWTFLPGIGQGYAKRICKFRESLGGFSSVDQVSETFGLPDSVFHRIQPFLAWSPIPKGIRINDHSAEELAKHPYMRPKEARILVNYRDQHGPYRTTQDIRKSMAIQDTFRFAQLRPYWRFDQD